MRWKSKTVLAPPLLAGVLLMLFKHGVRTFLRNTCHNVSNVFFPLPRPCLSLVMFGIPSLQWSKCCVGGFLRSFSPGLLKNMGLDSDCLGTYDLSQSYWNDTRVDNAGRSWLWIVYVSSVKQDNLILTRITGATKWVTYRKVLLKDNLQLSVGLSNPFMMKFVIVHISHNIVTDPDN